MLGALAVEQRKLDDLPFGRRQDRIDDAVDGTADADIDHTAFRDAGAQGEAHVGDIADGIKRPVSGCCACAGGGVGRAASGAARGAACGVRCCCCWACGAGAGICGVACAAAPDAEARKAMRLVRSLSRRRPGNAILFFGMKVCGASRY
ncbi:MAG: hypothetical protein M5U33_00820 [Pseudorhodoplanes sp.]|nr:hypothetical protein [Pseudorhodoplanes sp.]